MYFSYTTVTFVAFPQRLCQEQERCFFFFFFVVVIFVARSFDVLCRLPEVSRVRKAAVALGQFLQQLHQLGEAGTLVLLQGPAQQQNVLTHTHTHK